MCWAEQSSLSFFPGEKSPGLTLHSTIEPYERQNADGNKQDLILNSRLNIKMSDEEIVCLFY